MFRSPPLKDCFADHQDGLRAIVASGDFTVVVPLVGKSSRASLHSPTRLFCGSPRWSQDMVASGDFTIVTSGDFTVIVF